MVSIENSGVRKFRVCRCLELGMPLLTWAGPSDRTSWLGSNLIPSNLPFFSPSAVEESPVWYRELFTPKQEDHSPNKSVGEARPQVGSSSNALTFYLWEYNGFRSCTAVYYLGERDRGSETNFAPETYLVLLCKLKKEVIIHLEMCRSSRIHPDTFVRSEHTPIKVETLSHILQASHMPLPGITSTK